MRDELGSALAQLLPCCTKPGNEFLTGEVWDSRSPRDLLHQLPQLQARGVRAALRGPSLPGRQSGAVMRFLAPPEPLTKCFCSHSPAAATRASPRRHSGLKGSFVRHHGQGTGDSRQPAGTAPSMEPREGRRRRRGEGMSGMGTPMGCGWRKDLGWREMVR